MNRLWSPLCSRCPRPHWTGWVRKCLAKNRDQRWHSAHDLHDELAWIAELGSQVVEPTVASPAAPRSGLFVLGGVLLATAIGVGFGIGRIGRVNVVVTPSLPSHLEITLPEPQRLHPVAQRVIALSADGGLAYVTVGPDARIHVRRLDSVEPVPVSGTEGGTSPFFSPDGDWLGFWKDRQLYKVALAGGAPIALCAARTMYGASWGPDDRIVFGQSHLGVFEVSAAGGDPELLVAPNQSDGEVAIDGPQLLPDGQSLLFTLLKTGQNWDGASIVVQRLDTGERRVLVEGGTDAHYVPTGHLLFVRERALYALPFDPNDQAVRGSPVPVVEGLWRAFMYETGAGQFSVSENGTLVYVLAQPSAGSTLVWVDRTGAEEVLPMPPRQYFHARLSPDGQRIVVDTIGEQDIWIYELARGTMARLTTEQTHLHPVWSADGNAVVFDSDLGVALERKRVGSPQPVESVRWMTRSF